MDIQKQSTKFVKPATQTPPTLHHYKIGFIDECAPAFNLNFVLFYSDINDNPNLVSQLEKSLEKTLPRFYPLAGRYLKEDHVIECLDQGVEFIYAKVINIKYEDIVGSEVNLKLVDEFIPSPFGAVDQVTDPLLSIQVTTFEYGGGVALGISLSHRVGDAATLFIFLNEWAGICRGEIISHDEFTGPGFNSASFFPARGSSPKQVIRSFPRTKSSENMHRSKYVTKKISFSESEIANLRDKIFGSQQQYFSKVQLVSALIWKALIKIDQRTNGPYPPRCSVLLWAIDLRGKITNSSIPRDSCGNLSALLATKCETNVETESLARLLKNCVKDFIGDYSKVSHDNEQMQTMVYNSLSYTATIPPNATPIRLISLCKFPYYELDFGFGKPIWVTCGRALGTNVVYLMDDVGGNGIEAFVGVEHKDVPYFEEALLNIKAFAT